tara:strand:+ start:35 stop:784 length:750 start_codon:yes stop_codon:yes gene_type:complete
MAYIGQKPADKPLGASDITDGIISTAKLADTSVTNAKLNADIISAETELAVSPASTDEILISDAGVLKRIDASLIGSQDVVKISEAHTDSSATTVDFTLDTSTYDHFQLYWWSKPASDGYSVRARWMVDSTEQTGSDYNHGHFGTTSTNNYYSILGENADHFRIINNAGNENIQGHHFYATITPRKSGNIQRFNNVMTWFAIRTDSSNNFRPIYGCAWYNGSDYEPNKIRIYMESGDFSAYAYSFYGIK